MSDIEYPEGTRAGFAAIIGAPNAGKSTLVNRLVGAKVSIVTHKVQTTRTRLRGICMAGASQIVLVDTPGIFKPQRRLDKAMVEAAWGGAAEADIVLFLIDAPLYLESYAHQKPSAAAIKSAEDVARILKALTKDKREAVLVLNKIDDIKRPDLLSLTERLQSEAQFSEVFMISALKGDGVEDLKAWLAAQMPEGPWLYPEDQVADLPMRMLAAEITREQTILRLHQELPYVSTVETESWKDLRDGSVRIEQVIYVQRASQKAIVLGKGGRTIKDIGQKARSAMEESFGRKVHLFLFAKVREKWGDDPERFREMGLDFPSM